MRASRTPGRWRQRRQVGVDDQATPVTLPLLTASILLTGAPKPISPDLFGIFFEDLSYAADGGLYPERVQNRSFEYSAADREGWNGLTGWTTVKGEGDVGTVGLRNGAPLNASNPHYAVLMVEKGALGLRNEGFDGMALKAGEAYDLSLFTCAFAGRPGPIRVRLEAKDGALLAQTTLAAPTESWATRTATLVSNADTANGRLVVLASNVGDSMPAGTGLDMVSLFPRRTFHDRSNGLRPDLAQAIADLRPKFVRFPGGCVAHGNGLGNMYRWKDTIGPVEARREQPNIWGYHQTAGLGYYEYFQFCEDIGAKPLPVLPAAVCCQNSGQYWGKGQESLPMTAMNDYVQEALDLVEWANGPTTSKWGARRGAQGHPRPFGLEYLAIGNEDAITPAFEERFTMIYRAVHAKYPKLKLIGTVGPAPDGDDFEAGWRLARKDRVDTVDEHYYVSPDWFWEHLTRYDGYDRAGTKVYVGEYAAHEPKRENTLRAALAEAAHLTSLECNGDVVRLASYAPLLAKQGHVSWRPDLIYFDNATVTPSVNYEVQRLFMRNAGDLYLPARIKGPTGQIAGSVVQDSKTGDVIVKLVSCADTPTAAHVDLSSMKGLRPEATRTVLVGDPLAENAFGKPPTLVPRTNAMTVTPAFDIELPPTSFTMIRAKTR